MQTQKPRISFTFPYRWINDPEDRKYLDENLLKEVRGGSQYAVMHANLPMPTANAYIVHLKYYAYQPVKIKLTKKEIEKILKPFFGNAPCAAFETFFVQKPRPGLPVMEMEIYF